MSRAYLVVEGQTDIRLLQRILPPAILQDVLLVDGRGKYGAESLARSLVATRDVPVVLLIDADTSDEALVAQKQQDLTYLLHQVSSGGTFEILLAVPEIETVFFTDRTLLENLIERQLTDLEWQLGQKQPKQLLETVVETSDLVSDLLEQLTAEQIELLCQHPLLKALQAFLATEAQAA